MDSVHSHANWAAGIGGVSYPLLADFHPKGAVAESYGLYLADKGITDRATVIIDAGGVIRHISSVTPAGKRNMEELATLCENVSAQFSGDVAGLPASEGLTGDVDLFVKSQCGFSRSVLLARENLHLQDKVAVHNVSESTEAMSRLKEVSGSEQAPCLVVNGRAMQESGEIVAHLVSKSAGL